ncbi:DUF6247 family protein [Actinomycetospora sp. C-140]
MTAAASPHPPEGGRAWAEATPGQVRAALAPESATEFDRQWRAALAGAAESYDLSTVHACLDAWRRVAEVTAAAGGAEGYRRLRARAAEALDREVPAARWSEVRAELGL